MKKFLIGILIFVNFSFATEVSLRVANGFSLPSGLHLSKDPFYELTVKENYEQFAFSVWHGSSDILGTASGKGFKETDYSISYKNFTLAYFDIPGENDIIFTKYKLPYGFVFKTLNPKGKKSGIQITKSFSLAQNMSIVTTTGTDAFTGNYFFTPNLKYIYSLKGLDIVTEVKVPFGEARHKPHVIVGIGYSF